MGGWPSFYSFKPRNTHLERQPASLASVLKEYRKTANKVNANDNLTDKGKSEELKKARDKANNDLSLIKREINVNKATAREKLEAGTARPGIEGVEGEMRHNRLFGRVQAQLSNGQTIHQVIKNSDRETLDVIREEAPYFWPDEASGIEKLASQYDRALMDSHEVRAHDQLEELDSGSHKLDMSVSQVENEINGKGTATFIPAYYADQQGHNVSPANDAA